MTPRRTFSYRVAEWYFRRKFGDVLDPLRAMGHHKRVMQAYGRFEQGAGSWRRLDRSLADLADMATVARIGCPWCLDFGYWVMHTHGISHEKIEAVPTWRESGSFDPLERLAMEYAEAMTETPPAVDDGLVERLLQHLDEAQLVELTMIICLENVRSRFNAVLRLTAQGFKGRCEMPQLEAR